jgi:hypothetical protein
MSQIVQVSLEKRQNYKKKSTYYLMHISNKWNERSILPQENRKQTLTKDIMLVPSENSGTRRQFGGTGRCNIIVPG